MNELRIFVDFAAPPDVMEMLRARTGRHQLVFPERPISSVLAKGEPDPHFATVDVAFGQPDVQAITAAPHLKWIHVSSSGITRYDNPEFRALVVARKGAREGRRTAVPFGPFLAFGAVIAVYAGQPIIDLYINHFVH